MPTLPSPPAGPCIPGRTLILAYVCSPGGDWSESPVLVDSAELVDAGAGGGPEGRAIVGVALKARPCGGCHGPDVVGVIKATAEAIKAGFEMGLRAAAK